MADENLKMDGRSRAARAARREEARPQTVVTADDLARAETALSECMTKLADSNPILKQHPLFAAAFV